MRRVENECVGCKDIGLPCVGSSCPNRNIVRWYCDECGEETTLYYYDDDIELCADCLLGKFEIIEDSEY